MKKKKLTKKTLKRYVFWNGFTCKARDIEEAVKISNSQPGCVNHINIESLKTAC